ncbi:NmrA family NAD(P)-binding protein [Dactylosporangium sp. NPDC000521]|uniref:NmrA family NAD(P)-binding protein n=1 Tax=Dactylosporangium sp. NPDC000521 TaxID=3363975 RepID=UPI0036D1EE75
MTTVLVVGATGKQGGAVARLLLDHGHAVTAFVRAPSSPAAAARGADAVFGLSVPFGAGGVAEEVAQGRVLVDTAAKAGAHLVYSSVRGADRAVATDIGHADSKQSVEAYLRARDDLRATVLGPVYFMRTR